MQGTEQARHMALEVVATMPPAGQLASPLDYIFADHFRLRTLCAMLDRIAGERSVDRQAVAAALRFLRDEFGLHVRDEEDDLFPLLRRRTEPEDRIERTLAELCQEHAADREDVRRIVDGLARIAASGSGRRPADRFRRLLRRFAANERRHLILENAIVLPLARARLTVDDLGNLGRRMAARRGIDYRELVHAV